MWLAAILLCLGIKRAVWIHVGILLLFFVWALCPWDKFAMVIVLYFLWIPISMCAVWSLTRIIRAEEKRKTRRPRVTPHPCSGIVSSCFQLFELFPSKRTDIPPVRFFCLKSAALCILPLLFQGKCDKISFQYL